MKSNEILELLDSNKSFSDENIDAFCGKCVGCACYSSKPTLPKLLRVTGDFVLSDGGTCFKPRILKRYKGNWGEDLYKPTFNFKSQEFYDKLKEIESKTEKQTKI